MFEEIIIPNKYVNPIELESRKGIRIPQPIYAPLPANVADSIKHYQDFELFDDGTVPVPLETGGKPLEGSTPACDVFTNESLSYFGEFANEIIETCKIKWDSKEDEGDKGWLIWKVSNAASIDYEHFFKLTLQSAGYDVTKVSGASIIDFKAKYGMDKDTLKLRLNDGKVKIRSVFRYEDITIEADWAIANAALSTVVDEEKLNILIDKETQKEENRQKAKLWVPLCGSGLAVGAFISSLLYFSTRKKIKTVKDFNEANINEGDRINKTKESTQKEDLGSEEKSWLLSWFLGRLVVHSVEEARKKGIPLGLTMPEQRRMMAEYHRQLYGNTDSASQADEDLEK